MFTENYINAKKACFLGATWNCVQLDGTPISSVSFGNSTYAEIGVGMCKPKGTTPSSNTSNIDGVIGVIFGTGTTPASKEDYKLEAQITSGLEISCSGYKPIVSEEIEGKYDVLASYVIKNTTGNTIHIYEIGSVGAINRGTSSSPLYFPALLERTVLTEPITIQAGQAKVVTYKLTFNQTLNVEA